MQGTTFYLACFALVLGNELAITRGAAALHSPWSTVNLPEPAVQKAIQFVAAETGKSTSTSAASIINIAQDSNLTEAVAYGLPAKPGQFPYMASLLKPANPSGLYHACGATLIAPNLLLTAAHCLYNDTGSWDPPVYSLLGGTDLSSVANFAEMIPIVSYYFPTYSFTNFSTQGNDIAILRLANASSQPVVRLSKRTQVRNRLLLVTVGWGATEHNSSTSKLLRFAPMRVSDSACPDLPEGALCEIGMHPKRVGVGQTGTCAGDSGGPQVILARTGQAVQVSITSFGPATACGLGSWGAYTSVAYYQTSFIMPIMAAHAQNPKNPHQHSTPPQRAGGRGPPITDLQPLQPPSLPPTSTPPPHHFRRRTPKPKRRHHGKRRHRTKLRF